MKDKNNEILKDVENTDGGKNVDPLYTKIKFDAILSDYQLNMILKIIEYAKGFVLSADDLKKYWEKYHLPIPVKPVSYVLLLDAMNGSPHICIQHINGKSYYDYCACRHFALPLLMNENISAMDKGISDYRNGIVGILKLSQTLSQSLMLINSEIYNFFIDAMLDDDVNPELESLNSALPNRDFFYVAKELNDFIQGFYNAYDNLPGVLPNSTILALNAALILERNKCSFSAFCGLFLDAVWGTEEYLKPLRDIEYQIQHRFQGAELYRLEIPSSPVDTSIPIGTRGPNAHTTLMKLFLIDTDGNRVLVRIDLPHVNSLKFHINVNCPDSKKYSAMSHYEIEADRHDDSLNRVFDSLKASISEQMPHLLVIQDTDRADENRILEDMRKYIDYLTLCSNYICNKTYEKPLRKVAGYLTISDTSIDNVLAEAGNHYRV